MGIMGGALASEIILIIVIALVLFIIFKIGKLLLRVIFGIIANSVLGVIAIFALDYLFALGIPLELPEIAASAIFGLPAVGTMVILRLFGLLV
ncbi:MAG: pro-sigmaK processing inhibitor BofA family protein [Candidatus Micrarchaeaceae archaeon]